MLGSHFDIYMLAEIPINNSFQQTLLHNFSRGPFLKDFKYPVTQPQRERVRRQAWPRSGYKKSQTYHKVRLQWGTTIFGKPSNMNFAFNISVLQSGSTFLDCPGDFRRFQLRQFTFYSRLVATIIFAF